LSLLVLDNSAEKRQNTEDKREKIQALSLAKECYSMKLDLLTNATVVDDAIRFVSSNKTKEKQKSSLDNSNEDDTEEAKAADYDEDVSRSQEQKTGKITNMVF
jgi:hypothetical protein